MSRPTMEVLDFEECTQLLGQIPVGRIAITVQALPMILPVNFALVDDSILFRTIPGSKLAAATSRAVVAFEVDSYQDDGRSGWSVVAQGMASKVTDPAVLEKARASGIESWALGDQAEHVVRIGLSTLTGRRFTALT
jgi:nitroimidazol reductase NimA-like FMN-containing flavoprotein (pyridoxamine 5'-phosphate oxidase superfamily)